MSSRNSGMEITAEKVAILLGIIVQICAIVWVVAMMQSSIRINENNLSEINNKLTTAFSEVNTELSDVRVRLRAAESEISILSAIFDREVWRNRNDKEKN